MSSVVARSSAAVAIAVGIGLAVLFWYETGMVRRSTSPTYDEVSYLQMGFRLKGTGSFLPLVDAGSAPLPVIIDAVAARPYRTIDFSSYRLPQTARRVRLFHLVSIGLPLVLAVYFWLFKRRGLIVGGGAALLLALSPTFLAHASLATTDAAISLWSVVTLAALAWYHQQKRPWQLIPVALALGGAFSAKYSAVCLLPAVLFSLGWWRASIVTIAASVIVYGLHGWLNVPLLDPEKYLAWLGPGPAHDYWMNVFTRTNLPAPLVGALHQWIHQRGGTNSFVLGQMDSSAPWWYFPVAIAVKSTPTELAVFLSLPVLIVLGWRRRDHAFTLWVITLASFAGTLLLTRVNIGVRYALPLYPLAILCVADALPLMVVRASTLAVVATVAVAGQAISSVAIAPHYLSYFNMFVGGPTQGHHYLADSNLDWGQDLPALADELADLGRPSVCIAYFGKAAIKPYGIAAVDWHDAERCRRAEWFAISVTYMQVNYIDGHPFRLLLAEPPDRRAGYSIFLYDLRRRPKVLQLLESAWANGAH